MDLLGVAVSASAGVGFIVSGPFVGYRLWKYGPRYSFDETVPFHKRWSCVNWRRFGEYSFYTAMGPLGIRLAAGAAGVFMCSAADILNKDHIAQWQMMDRIMITARSCCYVFLGLVGLGVAGGMARSVFKLVRNSSTRRQ
jgi:hypothetical protein